MPEDTTRAVNPPHRSHPSVGAAEVAPQVERVPDSGVVGRRIRGVDIGRALVTIRCVGLHPSILVALGAGAMPVEQHRPCHRTLRIMRGET